MSTRMNVPRIASLPCSFVNGDGLSGFFCRLIQDSTSFQNCPCHDGVCWMTVTPCSSIQLYASVFADPRYMQNGINEPMPFLIDERTAAFMRSVCCSSESDWSMNTHGMRSFEEEKSAETSPRCGRSSPDTTCRVMRAHKHAPVARRVLLDVRHARRLGVINHDPDCISRVFDACCRAEEHELWRAFGCSYVCLCCWLLSNCSAFSAWCE